MTEVLNILQILNGTVRRFKGDDLYLQRLK